MILAILAAAAATAATPAPARCTFDTLPAAEQQRYRSRYNRRVRTEGRAEAEEWLRWWACPDPADKARRDAAKARGPAGADGKPCARTRMEMRPVTGMDGSMTMVPRAVCAK